MKLGWIADNFYPDVKRGAEIEDYLLIQEGLRRGHEIIKMGKLSKDVDVFIVANFLDNINIGELFAYLSRKPYIKIEHDLRGPMIPFYKMLASEALLVVYHSPIQQRLIEQYGVVYKCFLHPMCSPAEFKDLGLKRKPETEVLYVGDYAKEKGYQEMVEWLEQRPDYTIWHYGCYDEQTEILTDKGWKYFRDLSKEDKVATLDKNNILIYQYPISYTKYYYSGKMFSQKGHLIDILVTLDHNLWLRTYNTPKWKFITAINSPRYVKYKRNAIWNGTEQKYFILPLIKNQTRKEQRLDLKILMDDWLEFFGYWITEGCNCGKPPKNYRVKISQSQKVNSETYEKIKKCMERLGYKYYINKEYFTISNKQLWNYLEQFGHAKDKFIPRELLQLSSRQLKILFDSMMYGDGDKKGTRYATISKQLTDDFQELLLKIGLAGTMAKILTKTNPQFHVFISKRKLEPIANHTKDERSIIEYSGNVYCVTVPNHIVYIRRNGKPCWCGNSGFPKHHPRMKEMESIEHEDMPKIYNQFQTLIFLPAFQQACSRVIAEAYLCKVPNIITNGKDGFTSYGWTMNDYDKVRERLTNAHNILWDKMEEEFSNAS